ncbi:MAG: AtpZ/AtpI family protein [Candidatus Roizmanbacteria bacterium]|nr:MAG: AtpZ/AtpI family protein [Candidatus Roizmanbacteria bacterium]
MKKKQKISKIDNEGNIVEVKKESSKSNTLTAEQIVRYGDYLNLGFYLVAPLLVAVLAGFYFDKWLNTKPFFILLFIFLGSVATFYNLIKLTKDKDAPH